MLLQFGETNCQGARLPHGQRVPAGSERRAVLPGQSRARLRRGLPFVSRAAGQSGRARGRAPCRRGDLSPRRTRPTRYGPQPRLRAALSESARTRQPHARSVRPDEPPIPAVSNLHPVRVHVLVEFAVPATHRRSAGPRPASNRNLREQSVRHRQRPGLGDRERLLCQYELLRPSLGRHVLRPRPSTYDAPGAAAGNGDRIQQLQSSPELVHEGAGEPTHEYERGERPREHVLRS